MTVEVSCKIQIKTVSDHKVCCFRPMYTPKRALLRSRLKHVPIREQAFRLLNDPTVLQWRDRHWTLQDPATLRFAVRSCIGLEGVPVAELPVDLVMHALFT